MTLRRTHPLPFARPSITDAEIEAVTEAMRSGWLTTGPRTAQFEEEFAASVDAPAALALSSGTAALHLALIALGIRAGDVVATTPMTFCSTVHVIEHLGARPLLIDVEAESLNLDPRRLEAALQSGSEISAVIPVHLAGQPADMRGIGAVVEPMKIPVVEDAAHAQAAISNGRPVGSVDPDNHARAACFSFYATKNITTGEGGMLTGSSDVVAKAREWSLHGMSRDSWNRYDSGGSWFYEVTKPGFKYNMTDTQAAMGLVQLRRSDELLARRREIARRYDEAFADLEMLTLPWRSSNDEHAWHLYSIRLNPTLTSVTRKTFIEQMTKLRIGTSVHFIPIYRHAYYRDKYGFSPNDFPVADQAFDQLVSLPIYPLMSDEDVSDVTSAVRSILLDSHRA